MNFHKNDENYVRVTSYLSFCLSFFYFSYFSISSTFLFFPSFLSLSIFTYVFSRFFNFLFKYILSLYILNFIEIRPKEKRDIKIIILTLSSINNKWFLVVWMDIDKSKMKILLHYDYFYYQLKRAQEYLYYHKLIKNIESLLNK
jgi:hypothetical protein